MPKYEVTFTRRIHKEVSYTVQAKDAEDAKEEALDLFIGDSHKAWQEKLYDSDTIVEELNSASD